MKKPTSDIYTLSVYRKANMCTMNQHLLDMMSMGKNMIKDLLGAFPGIDEAMSFAEVMRWGNFILFNLTT